MALTLTKLQNKETIRRFLHPGKPRKLPQELSYDTPTVLQY